MAPSLSPEATNGALFLEAAHYIGRSLTRDALWANNCCNWVGASMEPLAEGWKTVERSFGPDFYGGTSGIGWFLAHLYRATGEEVFRDTALGALAQAWGRREELAGTSRYSFYTGQLGIAWALAHCAELLARGDLLDKAEQLLDSVQEAPPHPDALDVISGSAGAIPVLLELGARLRRVSCKEAALRHGEHLLREARRSEHGLSWRTISESTQADLTGFSHGGAGIGWALAELFACNGDRRFRDATLDAFRYERRWFVPAQQNWADLREFPNTRPPQETVCAVAWCHGAPGIALSRLRTFAILGEDDLRKEAEIAVRTTASTLDASASVEYGNYSQCHGHSGNAEALLFATETLGPAWRAPVDAAARRGIDRYITPHAPWPCGVPNGGENPSLMLGLAGIGYFYLRLVDSKKVPPVTIVTPAVEITR